MWARYDLKRVNKEGTEGSSSTTFHTGLSFSHRRLLRRRYQGESDVGPVGGWSNGVSFFGSAYYGCALSAMLRDWRVALRQPALPFLVVELAGECRSGGL